MKPLRTSFTDHPFRRQPHARRDICGCGALPMGFMPENRFGAGGKRVFCWLQRQAGLAIQPLFGLGFRLRWSGSAVEGLSVFGYGLAARARVLSVLLFVLSMNLGESARISGFGKRHHRVFRHSRKYSRWLSIRTTLGICVTIHPILYPLTTKAGMV